VLRAAAFFCTCEKALREENPLPLDTNEREKAMENATIRIDQDEEAFLISEISDEAIEAAAGRVTDGAGSATIAFCSGLDTCPA
jgi:hypothetical protein